MAAPKLLVIKETPAELRRLQKNSIPMIAARIRVLPELKQYEATGVSKRTVAEAAGVNHNSVQSWRACYAKGGLTELLKHGRKGARPSKITPGEHALLEQKLRDPKNGLRGYVELVAWAEAEFQKTIKYNTLFKYTTRHFGTKVRVARKSHVNKDEKAVQLFKKTLRTPVVRPVRVVGTATKV